ncbi:peptide deformylase [Salmonella enterica]
MIQHECDHLDGKVYLDRMKSMLELSTAGNFKHFHLPKPPEESAEPKDAK